MMEFAVRARPPSGCAAQHVSFRVRPVDDCADLVDGAVGRFRRILSCWWGWLRVGGFCWWQTELAVEMLQGGMKQGLPKSDAVDQPFLQGLVRLPNRRIHPN